MIHKRLFTFLYVLWLFFIYGCTGIPLFVPNPPVKKKEVSDTTSLSSIKTTSEKDTSLINKAGISDENELDFALAFVDTKKEQISVESEITQVIKPDEKLRYDSISSQTFTVPSDMARIALFQNIKKIIIYSLGTIVLSISEKDKKVSCRGRISVTSIRERSDRSYALIEIQSRKRYYISLPCTLLAISNRNYFELGENSYRGSIIVAPEKNGFFSVINLCHVEEYLQGVVPLEIGKRSEKDIEAIKAQAIAARTYTYKRILERQKQPYDLLPTVADQVYGGANVEYPLSNRAIKATKGMVLIYGDSLIYAYYHSTCGGITANVEDVWEKQPAPYLRSRKDVDQDGKPYCSISKFFTWKESWRNSDL